MGAVPIGAAQNVDRKGRIMDSPSGLMWSIVVVGGPAVLALVLLWALLRNRGRRGGDANTEQATRDVYRREEEARRDGSDGAA
jgi:hypothetical protein